MVTLSPTKIFTKFFLILPLIVARMRGWVSRAPSILQRNIALGRASTTTASTSMTSSLTFLTRSFLFFRSFPCARASFFPKSIVGEKVMLALFSWDWYVLTIGEWVVIRFCWLLTLVLLHDVVKGVVKAAAWKQKMMERNKMMNGVIWWVVRLKSWISITIFGRSCNKIVRQVHW